MCCTLLSSYGIQVWNLHQVVISCMLPIMEMFSWWYNHTVNVNSVFYEPQRCFHPCNFYINWQACCNGFNGLYIILLSYGHGPVQIPFRSHSSQLVLIRFFTHLTPARVFETVKCLFYPASRWLSLTGPWLPASAIHFVARFTELAAPPFPAVHAVCVAPGLPWSPYQAMEGPGALGLGARCLYLVKTD